MSKPEPGFYEVAPGVVVAFSGDEDPIDWLNRVLDASLAEGPDEQDDAGDQDPEPGEPVRQVPGEKERDTRVS
jgi:hypothetical protein